jgi:hypothetical protein
MYLVIDVQYGQRQLPNNFWTSSSLISDTIEIAAIRLISGSDSHLLRCILEVFAGFPKQTYGGHKDMWFIYLWRETECSFPAKTTDQTMNKKTELQIIPQCLLQCTHSFKGSRCSEESRNWQGLLILLLGFESSSYIVDCRWGICTCFHT